MTQLLTVLFLLLWDGLPGYHLIHGQLLLTVRIVNYELGDPDIDEFLHHLDEDLLRILVKYGTINDDMVLDWLATFWDKLGPLVKGMQKAMGSPAWLENYEYLATRKEEWNKKHK